MCVKNTDLLLLSSFLTPPCFMLHDCLHRAELLDEFCVTPDTRATQAEVDLATNVAHGQAKQTAKHDLQGCCMLPQLVRTNNHP